MAETLNAPRVTNLPKTNLHETDVKFITETVKVISNIDGANEMRIRIHDKLPSIFSVTINNPPKMTPDDLKQLQMLNTRLRKIKFNLDLKRLILESWKYKKEPKQKKRRRDEEYLHHTNTLPKKYNMEMIDQMDKPQVSGIISYFIECTQIEFNIKIESDPSCYNLYLTNLEPFDMSLMDTMIKKYGAFVSKIRFNFPTKSLDLTIRRNDCQLDKITSIRLKKVKINHH